MEEYEFEVTPYGVRGVLPSGEERDFSSEEEYHEAYIAEEDEFISEIERLHFYDEPIDYPEDWNVSA